MPAFLCARTKESEGGRKGWGGGGGVGGRGSKFEHWINNTQDMTS